MRDVIIRILGHDHTGAATRSAARNFARLRANIARMMVQLTTYLTAFGSLLGPILNGFAAMSTAVGELVADLWPLLATLPAIAAAMTLVIGTIRMGAPAMGAALRPIGRAFAGIRDEIGELASAGLGRLARGFVRVNFPAIRDSMERLAVATNRVVRGVLGWLNTIDGQRTVRTVTEATASAFERLGPQVSNLVVSLGRMTRRVGDPAIRAFAGLLGTIADRVARWANGVTRADVLNAIQRLKSVSSATADAWRDIKDAVEWLTEHRGQITAASDAVAVAGLALGLATGNLPAVVAASATLLLNHFDWFRERLADAGKWIGQTWQKIAQNPWIQRIKAAFEDIGGYIRGDFSRAWKYLSGRIDELKESFSEAWETVGPFIERVLRNEDVRNGLRMIALGVGAAATAFIIFAVAVGSAAAIITAALGAVIAWLVGNFVRGIAGVIDKVLGAFAWMARGIAAAVRPFNENLANSLENAATTADRAADRIRNALNGIHGVTIPINVITQVNGRQASVSDMGRIIAGSTRGQAIRFSGGQSFSMGTAGMQRTQAASPVAVTSQVFLDGQPFYAMTTNAVAAAVDRQAWRARTGRR